MTCLDQAKTSPKKLSENTGTTFSAIMPPFTSRGGGHNFGNDSTGIEIEEYMLNLCIDIGHIRPTKGGMSIGGRFCALWAEWVAE